MEPLDELKAMLAKYVMVEGGQGALDELAFFIAFKQRWFNMSDAKVLLAKALELGLLREEDGKAVLTFDVESLDLPTLFSPSGNLVSMLSDIDSSECPCQEETLLETIISRMAASTKKSTETLTKEVMNLREDTGFTPETAALVLASKYGVDIGGLVDDVRHTLAP